MAFFNCVRLISYASFPNTIFLKPFFEIFKDKLEKECRLKKAVMDPKRGIWHDNLNEIDLPPAKTKRYKRALISSQMAKVFSVFSRTDLF